MTRCETTDTETRRRFLAASALAVAGVGGGCLGQPTESSGDSTDTPSGTASDDPALDVEGVDVAAFFEYPLAGVHPHVYAREDTQFVLVEVDSAGEQSPRDVGDRLTLSVNGEPAPLADEQPVAWNGPMRVAFAVPKGREFERGAVRHDGTVLHALDESTLERLNNPPTFAVSDLRVAPAELTVGEQVEATVRFTLSNTGEGSGTFGASLRGNYSSGSTTVTATVGAGAERTVVGGVEVVGRDQPVTIDVDWGADERQVEIPVVETGTTGTRTGTNTETPLPTPS